MSDDVVDRMIQDSYEQASLELRGWESLTRLLEKMPPETRNRLLKAACERYGVN